VKVLNGEQIKSLKEILVPSKITVKHRFDDEIIMDEEVYPFAPSKKLYKVGNKWVKATCGGQNILDEWEGKQASECWMIDNLEEEKIKKESTVIYSRWWNFTYCRICWFFILW